MNKNTGKRGFSLSEALIAMLVVSLITLATVPVITKKKRNLNNGYHGQWVCYKNNGTHMVKSTINGKTTTTSAGSKCRFVPPAKSKNFSVKVIGGGGGGAAGTKPTMYTFASSTTFKPPKNGDYIVAVVGGGGGGGQIRCGTQARTGGSGGWDIQEVALRADRDCTITVGKGGEGNCGHNSKSRSKVDGKTTTFRCNGYTVQATGGEVGDSRDTDASDCDWKGWSHGKGGSPNGLDYIQTDQRYLFNKLLDQRILKYIPTGYYGAGGHVGDESGTSCGAGGSGTVAIQRINSSGGGAGTPGAAVIKSYPSLPVVNVVIGDGGKGGTSNAQAGKPGSNTVFGNLITALGGHGGEPDFNVSKGYNAKGENATNPQYTTTKLLTRSYGGNTQNNSSINATQSQYDGINGAGAAGAGGGGSLDAFGHGANGRPGVVIIEW